MNRVVLYEYIVDYIVAIQLQQLFSLQHSDQSCMARLSHFALVSDHWSQTGRQVQCTVPNASTGKVAEDEICRVSPVKSNLHKSRVYRVVVVVLCFIHRIKQRVQVQYPVAESVASVLQVSAPEAPLLHAHTVNASGYHVVRKLARVRQLSDGRASGG